MDVNNRLKPYSLHQGDNRRFALDSRRFYGKMCSSINLSRRISMIPSVLNGLPQSQPLSNAPVTIHSLEYDDPFSAADGVIDFYKSNPNSNASLRVSFSGYHVNLEIIACEELKAPLNDEDRRKWYWQEHLNKTPAQINFTSIQAPAGTRDSDIDFDIDFFGKWLSDYFFKVVRMKGQAKMTYSEERDPPADYKPLMTTSYR